MAQTISIGFEGDIIRSKKYKPELRSSIVTRARSLSKLATSYFLSEAKKDWDIFFLNNESTIGELMV